MAADDAKLLVRIEAMMRGFERQMAVVAKTGANTASKIESDFKRANDNVAKDFERGSRAATVSVGQTRAAVSNLSFQLNDIAMGLASGTSPFTIMVQQGSQVAQALQSVQGGAVGLGRVVASAFTSMLNPISLASFAIIGLGGAAISYISSVVSGSSEANAALENHADVIEALKDAYGEAAEGLSDYVAKSKSLATAQLEQQMKDLNTLLKEQSDLMGREFLTLPASAFEGNLALIDEVNIALRDFEQSVENGQPDVEALLATMRDIEQREGVPQVIKDAANAVIGMADVADDAAGKLLNLTSNLDDLGLATFKLQDQVKALGQVLFGTFSTDLTTIMETGITAVGALANQFEKVLKPAIEGSVEQIENIQRNIDTISRTPLGSLPPLTAGAGVFMPSQTQLQQFEDAKKEAKRAADEAERAAKQASKEAAREAERAAKQAQDRLNKAIANQAAVAVTAMESLLGKSENVAADAAQINAFLKSEGINLDAAQTAWCAAFVNAALAKVGIKGTGSQVATSFATWGQAIQSADVQPGDVLVQSRGRRPGQTGGHVGLATGAIRFERGVQQLEMISGNASDRVEKDWVNATEVIARRSSDALVLPANALDHIAESAKAASAASKKAADDAIQAREEMAAFWKDIAGGIVSDLRAGADAAEIFANALEKVADRLVEIGLNWIFGGGGVGGGIFGGMTGQGLLGGKILPGILHKGGIAGSGSRSYGRAVPAAAWAGAPSYQRGGYAGFKPGEVPVIAHRGEPIGLKANAARSSHDVANVRIMADPGTIADIADQRIRTASGTLVRVSVVESQKATRRNFGSMLGEAQTRQI